MNYDNTTKLNLFHLVNMKVYLEAWKSYGEIIPKPNALQIA